MDDFIENFNHTQFGSETIVIAVCNNECVSCLSDKTREWFKDLGSKEIENYKSMDTFCFIGARDQCIEKRGTGKPQNDPVQVT